MKDELSCSYSAPLTAFTTTSCILEAQSDWKKRCVSVLSTCTEAVGAEGCFPCSVLHCQRTSIVPILCQTDGSVTSHPAHFSKHDFPPPLFKIVYYCFLVFPRSPGSFTAFPQMHQQGLRESPELRSACCLLSMPTVISSGSVTTSKSKSS